MSSCSFLLFCLFSEGGRCVSQYTTFSTATNAHVRSAVTNTSHGRRCTDEVALSTLLSNFHATSPLQKSQFNNTFWCVGDLAPPRRAFRASNANTLKKHQAAPQKELEWPPYA